MEVQALPGPGEELEGSPPGLWPGREKLGADTPSFSAEQATEPITRNFVSVAWVLNFE